MQSKELRKFEIVTPRPLQSGHSMRIFPFAQKVQFVYSVAAKNKIIILEFPFK